MLKIPKFRLVALAALAMSLFQLNTAKAAVTAWDQCDEEALGMLIGSCDYLTGGDWDVGIIWYNCDSNGHMSGYYGECYVF